MNPNDEPVEMLSQPLLTGDGFLNPACLNELGAAIRNMPSVHDRLAGDPEWQAPGWTFRHDIVGALAKWACRQSPYGCPDNLEAVLKYLDAVLATAFKWDLGRMEHLSLCQISRALHGILLDQRVSYFDAWNKPRRQMTPEEAERYAFSNTRPADLDFIDLHALLQNVCLDIRDERRKNAAFDRDFEGRWAKAHPTSEEPT